MNFFVFHTISYMDYHFFSGGYGIYLFINVYDLNNKFYYNETFIIELYKEEAHIDGFYNYLQQLVGVRFEVKTH